MIQIFSPDGFPIGVMGFHDMEQAEAFFEYWKKGFEHQGYYSTSRFGKREEIPLDKLKEECTFKETYQWIPYIAPSEKKFKENR
jgi:hypothetical protein